MTERIYTDNLHGRIQAPSGDAVIRRLADTINNMLDRIEQDITKQTMFVSDASHEIRTPISVIKGYANLIDRWGKNNPKVMQESIDAIKAETERMEKLLASLLALTTSLNVIPTKNLQQVSLNMAAKEVIGAVSPASARAKIRLVENSEEVIVGNYPMIFQLIRIFLENGIKFTKDRAGLVSITVYGDEACSYFSVKDSGCGIGSEDLPFIFERFYRADESHNNAIPGFGLGLAIADMISKAHNATIAVYSEEGEGAEFTVSFPKTA